uniref:Defect at low temperature protein 1 n=1 Tax=Spongospora subterranea TaxID=70186 RepID=A0A0H5QF56_9EUKA|eukprot:CRZ00673.1 hypothetical protein [Spongospora subterranea]
MSSSNPWGSILPIHFIIITALLVLAVLVIVAVIKKRALTLASQRERIPRIRLPVGRNDMPRSVYAAMVNQSVKEHKIKAGIVPESPGEGDQGWGRVSVDRTNFEGVHFKTSIAKSFLVLEEAASVPRPGTKHLDFRTIRDFVAYLQTEFPSITDVLAREYIDFYERARFSQYQFDVNDYNKFMTLIMEILDRIQ